MDSKEMEKSAKNFSTIDLSSEYKSLFTNNDNSSTLSLPSCLWLPQTAVLNQGPIIKSPVMPIKQANNETPIKNQTILLHQNEVSEKEISSEEMSKYATTELSGFSEFNTNGSAIEREHHVTDKFNGILYHVIPTYNQINILFSTKGLYSQFVSGLDKELHSKSLSKDNPVYQTHLRGKKCVITCKKSDSSVLVTGPGNSIWRETTFLRLSLRLFKTFAAENEAEQPFQYQNSTPVEPRHLPHKTLPVSPIDFAKSICENEQDSNHQPSVTDINRKLNVLWDITRNLQEQINKINEIMSQLIQNAEAVQKTEKAQNHVTIDSSEDHRSKSVEINSIDRTCVSKVTPGTRTYSEVLSDNKSVHQPPVHNENAQTHQNTQNNKNSSSKKSNSRKSKSGKTTEISFDKGPATSQHQSSASRALIIGDSILSGINQKGLKNNVECQPISGATIDSLTEKLHIYDLKSFKEIIIYVSGNDVSQNYRADAMLGENVEMEYIEDRYE